MKKPGLVAFAELIEDGRAMGERELNRMKYRHTAGGEPVIEVLVRVLPEGEAPFEARMKAGVMKAYLLKPGVRVQVSYDPGQKQEVALDDEPQFILQRNPQLVKKG